MISEFLFEEKIFNIHSAPKTTEELRNLKKHYAKSTICLCGGGIIAIIGIFIIISFDLYSKSLDTILSEAIYGRWVFMLVGVFVLSCLIRRFINDWKDFLVSLQPIDPEDAPCIVKLCKTDSIVASYQNKVVAQKRSLFKGEKEAMSDWVYLERKTPEDKDKAKTKVDKVAYEKLSKPIDYKGENK